MQGARKSETLGLLFYSQQALRLRLKLWSKHLTQRAARHNLAPQAAWGCGVGLCKMNLAPDSVLNELRSPRGHPARLSRLRAVFGLVEKVLIAKLLDFSVVGEPVHVPRPWRYLGDIEVGRKEASRVGACPPIGLEGLQPSEQAKAICCCSHKSESRSCAVAEKADFQAMQREGVGFRGRDRSLVAMTWGLRKNRAAERGCSTGAG